MAITNAQQYKQLVNPPLDGKRPGYRGDAAYRSKSAQSSTKAGGQGNVGSQASFGGGRDKDNETAPQEYIGGQSYDVIVNDAANKKKREDAREEQRQLREIEKKKFIYEPANYPKYTPSYLKFLANLNREPNRRYFVDKVLKGKKCYCFIN